jgi:hypothetical protein
MLRRCQVAVVRSFSGNMQVSYRGRSADGVTAVPVMRHFLDGLSTDTVDLLANFALAPGGLNRVVGGNYAIVGVISDVEFRIRVGRARKKG